MSGRMRLVVVALLAPLPVVAIVTGFLYRAMAEAADAARHRAPGRMITVGGHRLHIHCTGAGSPAVILDSGLGAASFEWSWVQPLIAEFTTVCSYDRAGYGWSDEGPGPRSSGRLAEELRTLLGSHRVAPPWILVGHSFGGMNVRLLAARHPSEVAGLALLDALHEDFIEVSLWESLTRKVVAWLAPVGVPRLLRGLVADNSSLPESVQPGANAMRARAAAYRTVSAEISALPDSAAELRGADKPANITILVVSRGLRDPHNADELRWRESQSALAKLTPRTNQVVSPDASHYIHLNQPKFLAGEIRIMVEGWRRRAR